MHIPASSIHLSTPNGFMISMVQQNLVMHLIINLNFFLHTCSVNLLVLTILQNKHIAEGIVKKINMQKSYLALLVACFSVNLYSSNYLDHTFQGHTLSIKSICEIAQERSDIQYFKCQDIEPFNYKAFPIAKFPELEPNSGLLSETFVTIIPNGQVCSWHGWVKTGENIVQESIPHLNSLTAQIETLACYPFDNVKKISGRVAVITMVFDTVFGHWLYNILGRLALIESQGIEYDWLYVSYDKPYMRETLALWGVDPKKIITPFNDTKCIQADELIFPSHIGFRTPQPHEHVVTWVPIDELSRKWGVDPKIMALPKHMNLYNPKTETIPADVPVENYFLRWTPLCNYWSPWITNYLRNKFLPCIENKSYRFSKKIFISRQDANTRKMTNEDQVFALFEKEGFARYTLTKMSIEEQIALFHGAEIVVASIGSSLTNITFCNPGTTVIEIFQAFSDSTFYYLSQNLGLQHYCIQTMDFKDMRGVEDTTVPLFIIQNFINKHPEIFHNEN